MAGSSGGSSRDYWIQNNAGDINNRIRRLQIDQEYAKANPNRMTPMPDQEFQSRTRGLSQDWLSASEPAFASAQQGAYGRGMPRDRSGMQMPQATAQAQPALPQPAQPMMQQPATAQAQAGMMLQSSAQGMRSGGNFRTRMRPYENYQASYDPSTGMPVGLRVGKEGGAFYGELEFQPNGQNSARLAEMMKQNGGGLKLDATPRNVMPSNNQPSFYDLYMRDPEYRNMSLDQKLALSRGYDAQYNRPERINSGQATYDDFLNIISGGNKSLPGNAYNERKALRMLQAQQENNFNQQMGIDKSMREAAGLQIDRDYKAGMLGNAEDKMLMQQQAGGRGQRRGGQSQGDGGGLKGFNPSQLFFDENGNLMTSQDMVRRRSIAKVTADPRFARMPPDSPEFIKAVQEEDERGMSYFDKVFNASSGAMPLQGLQ